MGDLTRHFSRHEFACKCGCGFDTVDFELLTMLQLAADELENDLGEAVGCTVTSGCRCYKHNKRIGGSKRSQHLKARAGDTKWYLRSTKKPIHVDIVNKKFDSLLNGRGGLGKYNTFNHIDTRTSAHWRA